MSCILYELKLVVVRDSKGLQVGVTHSSIVEILVGKMNE